MKANTVEVEEPRVIKKINQVSEHIKIPYIDKVVGWV